MFKILMICAVIGLAAAYPAGEDVHAEVLSSKQDVRADGFDASLDISNHITRSESGDEHGNIKGSYGWISPEGEHVEVSYVADEHGYQPKSDWLPTSPPIPAEIERALAYIASHPQAQEYHN